MIDQRVLDEIKQRLDVSAVVGKKVALKKAGRELMGLCPFHGEKTPSFSVNDAKGFYHCFGCGSHGDLFTFIERTEGGAFLDIVKHLAGELGIDLTAPDDKRRRDLDEWHSIVPPPKTAPAAPLSGWDHVYEYRDLEGYLLRYVLRRDATASRPKKQIMPLTWGWLRDEKNPAGVTGWYYRHADSPRSLYGLEELAETDGRVLVVEGEKAVHAARVLFPGMAVVTWSAGGNASHLTDWSPLRGRDVILWPDRDRHVFPVTHAQAGAEKPWREQEGFLTMMRVAGALTPLGCTISIVDVEDLAGDGTDAADLSITADDAPRWLLPRLRRYDTAQDTPDPGLERDRAYDGPREGFVPHRVFVDEYLDQVNEAQKGEPGTVSGIPTGIPELDALLDGLQRGRVYVLAGATSSGKSAVALKFINHAAATPIPGEVDVTWAVGVASLEMPGTELVGRSAADGIGVPTQKQLSAGGLDDDTWARLVEWANAYGDRRIFIDESTELDFATLAARCRHQQRTSGLDLLVVDYLQLMDRGDGDNAASLLGAITRGTKNLAKELDIPIVMLSQLSRKVDERESHRPQTSDLRESGSIGQDADGVIFVHRPEQWLRLNEPKEPRENESDDKWRKRRGQWHDRMEKARGRLELLVDKNRGGPVGEIVTTIDLALMRIGEGVSEHMPRTAAPDRQMDKLNRGLDGLSPTDDVDTLAGYGPGHD